MKTSRRARLEEISRLESELDDAEEQIEEAKLERSRIENRLEQAQRELEDSPPICPRCDLEQSGIKDDTLCCPRCGYCEFVADGIPEQCPEHGARDREAVVA